METTTISTVSLITQGKHKFYSFTMESDILAKVCFVISRDEDPTTGFQRNLDERRAREIADYIDNGLGTIPSSIVLSAQKEAGLEYSSKNKSIKFNITNKSFLIIDGQHRVFGFKFAKSRLRVPVVVYDGLDIQDEARLFIDINSKQKGVPSELLLDIKKLADRETNIEALFREVYDTFHGSKNSVLYNRLSPTKSAKGKISRKTFNMALNSIYSVLESKTANEIYMILNNYLFSFSHLILSEASSEDYITNATVFRATVSFMQPVAMRVKDKFGPEYTIDNFERVIEEFKTRIKLNRIKSAGNSYQNLLKHFNDALEGGFSL